MRGSESRWGTDRSFGRGAIGMIALRTWQRTWRQCMLLAIVIALALGVVLAVLLGAARSETALDRLRAETVASDLLLGGGDQVGTLLDKVVSAEGVIAAGVVRQPSSSPRGRSSSLATTSSRLLRTRCRAGCQWTCLSSSRVVPLTKRWSTRC